MSCHSIKVPRIYKVASKIAEDVKEKGRSLKDLLYERKHPNVKGVLALVSKTIQHEHELDELLKRSKILDKESGLGDFLARVLITELLWGKKDLKGESKPVKTILAYKQILNAHGSEFKTDSKEEKFSRPRYVRVNTLKLSLDEAVRGFQDEQWRLVRFDKSEGYEAFLNKVRALATDEFILDFHIKNLLIFPPKTKFFQHEFYKDGSIFLQDKASCFPVQILDPPPGSTVLDLCAAPGMKTVHLVAHMNNNGAIYSVDYNSARFKALRNMIQLGGCTCVNTLKRDALTVTDTECPNVEYVLVDPSCSGSGMVERLDGNVKEPVDELRLQNLAGFQAKILRHALREFPNVKRVVYSTCSLHPEENEEVVRDVLLGTSSFKLVDVGKRLPGEWFSFGEGYGGIGERCFYSRPEKDLTNGFFFAVFERLEAGERNEFASRKHIKNQNAKEKCMMERKSEKNNKGKKKENVVVGKNISDEIFFQTDDTSGVADEELQVMSRKEKKKIKRRKSTAETRTKEKELNSSETVEGSKNKKGKFLEATNDDLCLETEQT